MDSLDWIRYREGRMKYEGTERRFGAELNIVKRAWLEAPLVRLIEMGYQTIEPHIRERQRLVDLFFEERLEYPTFAWQEAIVNVVAHRDYSYEGVGIEVWMFDDCDVIFTVVLHNTPVYSSETLRWLKQFEPLGLSGNQKRLLAYAREHDGTFTSRAYQKLVGVDIYTASRDIKDLIRKGVVRLPKKGGRVYELRAQEARRAPEKPPEYAAPEPVLERQGYVKNRVYVLPSAFLLSRPIELPDG